MEIEKKNSWQNPFRIFVYWEPFNDDYQMYHFMPLHYQHKNSIKINVAIEESNRRKEKWHWTKNKIGEGLLAISVTWNYCLVAQ